MKITFIIDPIRGLDPGHDTSVALMEAAQELGHEVWITEPRYLSVAESKAWAEVRPIRLFPVELLGERWVPPIPWFECGESQRVLLESMDAVFIRPDPPVDTAYLFATYILDYLDPQKTLVINSPAGLRLANEKMYALQFPQAIPQTIVTHEKALIRDFVGRLGSAVLKPLGGKAGEGILFLEAGDRNLNSLIEISTHQGRLPVMIQAYIPEAQEGDKRIILLAGEPIGAVNRVPTGSEFRSNMAVGGRVVHTEITPRERDICAQLAPALARDGLVFVGIDVIGGYLTEVNVTSPTGVREIDRLDGTKLGRQVIEWLAAQSSPGRSGPL